MTVQQYLQIENNVVTNIVLWDGEPTWIPPMDATMLVQLTIPAMIWVANSTGTEYVLTEVMGVGGIGFTWDGTVVTTNEPKPTVPVV